MGDTRSTPFVVLNFFSQSGVMRRVCFKDPLRVVAAQSVDEVRPALRRVQEAVDSGLYAAGYVAYEAAPAFDSVYAAHGRIAMPLVWFGVFDRPSDAGDVLTHGAYRLSEWSPSVSRGTYDRAIATVREAIARGDTYQANYTIRLHARFEGDDLAFYQRLDAAQSARYAAYLNIGRYRILSASPELFFRRQGANIITRPMKGTSRRGYWREQDERFADRLATSEKNRAENVMIVDLLRNDLGRIAEVGSVHVPRLFEIERYPTVLQMTSTVAARLPPETTLEEIFAALFPCGSVTGAPKVSTMRIIAAVEGRPRGVYCGSIGVVAPHDEAVFNVAIRTVMIDSETGAAEYGVGGGVTWDSTAHDEYAEALSKSALLTEEFPAFDLLETMRLERGGYFLLEEHLERLRASAKYFGFTLSPEKVRSALEQHARRFPQGVRRVRLLVSPDGGVRIESDSLEPGLNRPRVVALAPEPVSKHNRFLYHKTTHREVYDNRRAQCPDAFDVLLWNEEGELTEFTTGNLVLELEGGRWTPPRESGLLAGTFRADLMRRGEIKERVLTRADLGRSSRCWLINSVRGWTDVTFAPDVSTD